MLTCRVRFRPNIIHLSRGINLFLLLISIVFPSFRLEEVALKSRSSQAKIIGTIVSLAGAFVVTLYKGPQISFTGQTQSLLLNSPASNSDWVIGGLLITAEYILVTLWYIVQVTCTQNLLGIVHLLSDNVSFNSN